MRAKGLQRVSSRCHWHLRSLADVCIRGHRMPLMISHTDDTRSTEVKFMQPEWRLVVNISLAHNQNAGSNFFLKIETSCATAEFTTDRHETSDRGYDQHDKLSIGASQMCPKRPKRAYDNHDDLSWKADCKNGGDDDVTIGCPKHR